MNGKQRKSKPMFGYDPEVDCSDAVANGKRVSEALGETEDWLGPKKW